MPSLADLLNTKHNTIKVGVAYTANGVEWMVTGYCSDTDETEIQNLRTGKFVRVKRALLIEKAQGK
jgi:hypothetical protein